MMDVVHEEPVTAASTNANQKTSAKRRKVRKGTRSCWECKRRKIRCIFASSEDVTCVGCQHRRLPCVAQEMPEDLSPAKNANRHLGERIARVEDLMNDFLANKHTGAEILSEGKPGQDRRSNSNAIGSCLKDQAPLTPAEVRESSIVMPNTFPNHLLEPSRNRFTFTIPYTRVASCIKSSGE